MTFNFYKPFKSRSSSVKYISIFVLWMFSVLFFTNATNIATNIDNAVQYIKQIVLTNNWSSSWTTWVILDWSNSKVWSDRYCDRNMLNCKKIPTILTTWDINTLATTDLSSCNNWETPRFNWTSRICVTNTDKYIYSSSFNSSNWVLTLIWSWWSSNITTSLDWRYRTGTDLFVSDSNWVHYSAWNIGIWTNSSSSEKLQIWNINQIGSNYSCIADNIWWSYIRIIWNYDNSVVDQACTIPTIRSKKPNIQLNYVWINPSTINNWKINWWTSINFDYSSDWSNYINKMTILSGWQVWIWSSNPTCWWSSTCWLEINGKDFYVDGDSAFMNWNVGIWYNVVNDSTSSNLYISWNVWIWTNTPQANLEVNYILRIKPRWAIPTCWVSNEWSIYYDSWIKEFCFCKWTGNPRYKISDPAVSCP